MGIYNLVICYAGTPPLNGALEGIEATTSAERIEVEVSEQDACCLTP